MSEVETCLAAITALMRGHTDRNDEEAIVALFSAAPASVLDEVLDRLDLRHLLGDVDDRSSGPRHRSSLLDLLCRDRVDCLSVSVRAKLVHALSTGRTCDRDEHAIRDLFTHTVGRALTELKNAIDAGDDHRDLRQLVFSDIDDQRVRAEILGHIGRHASGLESREIKVLSDIDDTCYANWKDTRYPKKTVYPGVRQLYAELDRGPFEEPQRTGDLAFVTARPNDRIGFVEQATHETLAALGVGARTILTGSFRRLHSNRAIAARKLENFADYAMLYPEYDFVFIGDSGQGDAAFGAAMLQAEPSRVRAVFIHDVVATAPAERARWAERRVLFFDTYVGAAIAAFDLGLIQRAGVDRVAETAFAELEAIDFGEHPGKAERRAELERDRALIA
jgi:hypothetical protein